MQAVIPASFTLSTPGNLSSTTTMQRTATLDNPLDVWSLTSQVDTVTINGHAYTSTFDVGMDQV